MATILWTSGTAYDFFISLYALHHASDFGLRPMWTAGVRQRLSPASRELLEQISAFAVVPMAWINSLPDPKDAATALRAVADLEPAALFATLTLPSDLPADMYSTLNAIAARGSWTVDEKEKLAAFYCEQVKDWKQSDLDVLLKVWTAPGDYADQFTSALQEYYDVYFAEEETRLRPALEAGLARAQALSERLSPDALVEELSHGVHFAQIGLAQELILAPSYWSTPFVFQANLEAGKTLIIFGCRPEVESVSPGADAPDSLMNALKALADPTRLRVLRYLAHEPLSPSELARLLRLRPPTVIHHLRALRLAGLVTVRVGEENERRYAARLEALNVIFNSVQEFLSQD